MLIARGIERERQPAQPTRLDSAWQIARQKAILDCWIEQDAPYHRP